MSVSATVEMKLTVVETLDVNVPAISATASEKRVTHNGFNVSRTLPQSSPTSIPATKHAAFEVTIASSVGSIDLRDLDGVNNGAIDGNGLKVQAVIFKAKSTNSGPITIAEGASNGYELLGNGFTFALKPGQSAQFDLVEQAPDVGGSAKVLDLAGTNNDILQVQLVLG